MTSDHFDGRRFVNPGGMAAQPLSAVPRMLLDAANAVAGAYR